jgi:hypothetical protein
VGEFPLKSGHGEADYLLFVDAAPVGVVEAKKDGDICLCKTRSHPVPPSNGLRISTQREPLMASSPRGLS